MAGTSGAAFAAAFLAACGGDDDDGGSGSGTGTGGGATGGSTGGGATGSTGGGGGSTGAAGAITDQQGGLIFVSDMWQLPDETADAVPGGLYRRTEDLEFAGTQDANFEAGGRQIFHGVYEQLFRRNIDHGVEWGSPEMSEYVGHLATGYEVTPDAMTFTAKLRKGVQFQDIAPVSGREMDMEDVKASMERYLELNASRQNVAAVLDNVEYVDGETFVFHLNRPYAAFIEQIANWAWSPLIQPREIATDDDLAPTLTIGTGFRIFEDWQPDISWNFRRHENYWQNAAFIERWQHTIVPEQSGRLAQFLAQQSIEHRLPATDSREALNVRSQAGAEALMVGIPPDDTGMAVNRIGRDLFKVAEKPWNDERVRIAFRQAHDYESMDRFLSNQENLEKEGIDVQIFMGTHINCNPLYYLDPREGQLGDMSGNYLYNVEEARKRLEAAGAEIPVVETLFTSDSGPWAAERDELQLQKDSVEKSGLFKYELEVRPRNDFFQDQILGRDFPGIVYGNTPTEPLDYMLDRHVANHTGLADYADPEMDAIIDRYQATVDLEKRVEILKEYQMYAASKFYFLPGLGRYNAWRFEWPWLHNRFHQSYWQDTLRMSHLQWLDPNMPNRDG